MQDFTTYNYRITINDLLRAQYAQQNINVIINGEYYELKKSKYIDNPAQCKVDNGIAFQDILKIFEV